MYFHIIIEPAQDQPNASNGKMFLCEFPWIDGAIFIIANYISIFSVAFCLLCINAPYCETVCQIKKFIVTSWSDCLHLFGKINFQSCSTNLALQIV